MFTKITPLEVAYICNIFFYTLKNKPIELSIRENQTQRRKTINLKIILLGLPKFLGSSAYTSFAKYMAFWKTECSDIL